MRGAVSGGMVLALGALGFALGFDAAYGSSAGTLNVLWLISGRVEAGIPTWVDPKWADELIRRRRLLLGRPVVDVAGLVCTRYEQLSPGLFAAAFASPTTLHPLATDVATGEAVDLHAYIKDPPSLQRAVQASATLPLIAGPPISLAGHRFLDAAVATAFLTRAEGELRDEALLARHDADPALTPHVLSIRAAPGSPVPARLERDTEIVRAGLETGRVAVHAAFAGQH